MSGIATIADVERLEGIPLPQLDLPRDVLEVIERGRAICDGRDALVFMPDAARPHDVQRYSYDALIEAITQTAEGLGELGGSQDNVFAILLPNMPETHFALWGAQMVGRACPINPMLEPAAIANILRATSASVVVTLAPQPATGLFEKAIAAAQLAPAVTTIVVVEAAARLNALNDCLGARATAAGRRVVAFSELPKAASSGPPWRRGDGDVGALFHTGGTTGSPKIAQLTHANQVFAAWAANANRTMEHSRTIFCGLPLFHVNGALVTGLVTWFTGSTVLLGPPQGFRAPGLLQNFWGIVEHYKIGAMSAVPTIYAMLTEIPVGRHDLSSLEFCVCGAAPLRAETIDRFEALTGARLLEGYGLTEGSCVSTISPGYGVRHPGSVGLRTPYQEIGVFVEVEGQLQPVARAGISGSLFIRGPNVFAGYLNPDDDAKAWIEVSGARWYDTGDLGRVDAEGYLWLTGRKKDLIIRGGHNIDPAVIEDALSAHPAVRLAAAIGSPDSRLGEVPVAYVELHEGALIDEAALIDFVSTHISERAAIPRRIAIVDTIPLTAIGKTFKPELKRMEVERLASSLLKERFGEALDLIVRLDSERGLTAVVRAPDHAGLRQELSSVAEILSSCGVILESNGPD